MGHIKETIENAEGQQTPRLPASFSDTSQKTTKISIYGNGKLTGDVIARQFRKLQMAFPDLPKDFYEILSETIKEEGFCDQRLKDAVSNVIKTCEYPKPTIAKIVNFNKYIKLFTYDEACDLVKGPGRVLTNYCKPIIIEGSDRTMWARVDDVEKYKLKVKRNIL